MLSVNVVTRMISGTQKRFQFGEISNCFLDLLGYLRFTKWLLAYPLNSPDSKVHGANMGPTWVLSAPDGPHEPCYQGQYGSEVFGSHLILPVVWHILTQTKLRQFSKDIHSSVDNEWCWTWRDGGLHNEPMRSKFVEWQHKTHTDLNMHMALTVVIIAPIFR